MNWRKSQKRGNMATGKWEGLLVGSWRPAYKWQQAFMLTSVHQGYDFHVVRKELCGERMSMQENCAPVANKPSGEPKANKKAGLRRNERAGIIQEVPAGLPYSQIERWRQGVLALMTWKENQKRNWRWFRCIEVEVCPDERSEHRHPAWKEGNYGEAGTKKAQKREGVSK
jgi:hypothetical protein